MAEHRLRPAPTSAQPGRAVGERRLIVERDGYPGLRRLGVGPHVLARVLCSVLWSCCPGGPLSDRTLYERFS
jgi:hypothetical protein